MHFFKRIAVTLAFVSLIMGTALAAADDAAAVSQVSASGTMVKSLRRIPWVGVQ
jgi:hypothetical protein